MASYDDEESATELSDWEIVAIRDRVKKLKPAIFVKARKNKKGQWKESFDILLDENSPWAPPDFVKDSHQYEEYIMHSPELREGLQHLLGKTLGYRHHGFCYGQVLVKLVNKLLEFQPFKRSDDCIFFKGVDFILSSFYEIELFDSCLGRPHSPFKSAMQLFVVLYFCELELWNLAEKASRTQDSFLAHKIWRSFLHSNKVSCSASVQLRIMYYVLEIKWEASEEFRKYLTAHVECSHFAEATQNTFWACGVELHDITSATHPQNLPGKNLLGWLLRLLTLKKIGKENKWREEVKASFRQRRLSLIPFSPFEKGRILVDKACMKYL